MSVGQFTQLATDKIVPSPYQYRKTFGGAEDDELAQSIKKHGVLQPVRVRPNGAPGMFELVFGERRWRAAKAAELDEVPAIVVDLTDDQVIEQLLVENLSRKDVHPIEEGEGYHKLLHEYGYTIDQLVAKTSRSKAHLYGRIKLARELIAPARKAVLEGKLGVMHGELIARLDPKVQPEALQFALGKADYSDFEDSNVIPEGIGEHGKSWVNEDDHQPLSYRALQALIHRRFTLQLDKAPFAIYDERLVQAAGACTTCPYRTNNQPDLFPDLKKAADSCTKPSCFDAKVKANWELRAESAKARNMKVIAGKDAKAMFQHDGKPTHHGDYVAPDQELPYELARPGSKATWGKLLGKADVPRVLVQDELGHAHELIDKKAATKILREAGKLDEAKKPGSSGDSEYKKERAKEKQKRELRGEAFKRFILEVGQGAADIDLTMGRKAVPMMRWLCHRLLELDGIGAAEYVAPIVGTGEDPQAVVAKGIDGATTVSQLMSVLAVMLLANNADAIISEWKSGGVDVAAIEKIFGANWKKCVAAAATASKAETKVDATKKAKKGATKK